MEHSLKTSGGGTLTLERMDEQQVIALSTQPSPPGSLLSVGCDAGSFSIKVHSCKKLPDGELGFRIQGRPVNLGRRLREHLESRFVAKQPS